MKIASHSHKFGHLDYLRWSQVGRLGNSSVAFVIMVIVTKRIQSPDEQQLYNERCLLFF